MACENLVVHVKQGQLRGVVAENIYGGQFLAFRGIPFAKPPVGSLRFKDPESPEPWTGIRDASKFGDDCAQSDIFSEQRIGSDDCLYLNVYRPLNDSPKRAVMVWIHGGAFINGSGNDRLFGPDYLVRKDIVLVTINYRIGILGFLSLEHELAPGNQGLKDQVMALKWVQENIFNFGGDPDNVTIFGQSAGGASVHYLTISPLSRGLFHKAISQSGVAVNPWAITSIEPKKYALQVAAHLGEHSTDPATVLEFLRKCEPHKLVAAEAELRTPEKRFSRFGMLTPCVDDKSPNPFLPQHPSILMQSGVKVPFLLGYNKYEGTLLLKSLLVRVPSAVCCQKINENFEIIIHPETALSMQKDGITPNDVKHIYFGTKPVSEEQLPQYRDFVSDTMCRQGIYDVLQVLSQRTTQPIYFYTFTYDVGDSLLKHITNVPSQGPTHGDEIQYLFYPYMAKELGISAPQPGTEKYRVSEYFTQMWTDFAKTGNPTPKVTNTITTFWKPVKRDNGYNYARLNISRRLLMENSSKDDQRFDWKSMMNEVF